MWPFKKKQPASVQEAVFDPKEYKFVPVWEDQEFTLQVIPILYTFQDGQQIIKNVKGHIYQDYSINYGYMMPTRVYETSEFAKAIIDNSDCIHTAITVSNDDSSVSCTGIVTKREILKDKITSEVINKKVLIEFIKEEVVVTNDEQ